MFLRSTIDTSAHLLYERRRFRISRARQLYAEYLEKRVFARPLACAALDKFYREGAIDDTLVDIKTTKYFQLTPMMLYQLVGYRMLLAACMDVIRDHVLAEAQLTGKYSR